MTDLRGPVTVQQLIDLLATFDPAAEVRVFQQGSITRHLDVNYAALGDGCDHFGCTHGHGTVLIDAGWGPTLTQERDDA